MKKILLSLVTLMVLSISSYAGYHSITFNSHVSFPDQDGYDTGILEYKADVSKYSRFKIAADVYAGRLSGTQSSADVLLYNGTNMVQEIHASAYYPTQVHQESTYCGKADHIHYRFYGNDWDSNNRADITWEWW